MRLFRIIFKHCVCNCISIEFKQDWKWISVLTASVLGFAALKVDKYILTGILIWWNSQYLFFFYKSRLLGLRSSIACSRSKISTVLKSRELATPSSSTSLIVFFIFRWNFVSFLRWNVWIVLNELSVSWHMNIPRQTWCYVEPQFLEDQPHPCRPQSILSWLFDTSIRKKFNFLEIRKQSQPH